MRLAAVPLLLATSLVATIDARADEAPITTTEVALIAGATTVVLPLSLGATLVAQGDTLHVRNLGVGFAEGGLVLAPLVSHAIMGEPGRGLVFSAIPAAFAAGTTALLLVVPDTIDGGKLHIQYTFAALFIGAFLGSTIGIVDSLFSDGRARDRAASNAACGPRSSPRLAECGPRSSPRLTFFPTVAHGQFGLGLGGTL